MAGDGLLGQYYDNADLTGVSIVRVDPSVEFDWGTGAPGATMDADTFSIRWSGEVEVDFTEGYSFIVNANDGARLWVNGQLLIDEFQTGSVVEQVGSIELVAGRRYPIQLEYLENSGEASVSLEWMSASQPREVIPAAKLHSSSRGLVARELWESIPGSSVDDLTSNANFPNHPTSVSFFGESEVTTDQGDDFGARLSGYIHAPVSGPYRFYVSGDEAAELLLSPSSDPTAASTVAQIDSPTEYRQWDADAAQQSSLVWLNSGQKYYFAALHKEASGSDHLSVAWLRPDRIDPEVIAGEHLSPVLPTVKIFSEAPNVAEGSASKLRFTVTREGGPTTGPLEVSYAVAGEAVNGVDYQALPGVVTIPAGARSVDLEVVPITDALVEGNETLIVELAAAPGYRVGLKSERTANGNVQDDVSAPDGGVSLWNGQQLGDFQAFGGTFTTETDPTYGDVIQAVVSEGTNPWNSQLRQNIAAPVQEGDILFVEFRMRSIGSPGNLAAIFERTGAPFTKSLSQGIPVSTDWSRIQIPFIAVEGYAAGEASFGFHLAYRDQTLQFTDFSVLNYGPPKTLAPETAFGLNNISGNHGVAQLVQVDGQSFTFAYEVETTNVPDQNWHLQAVERNEGVVANGDTMRFTFSVRATAGADPRTGFLIQRTDNFATLYSQQIDLTGDWQNFTVDVPATDDFGIGGLQAVFNLGYGLQTVEIGGFHWTNESNSLDLEDLPNQFPAATYGGRSGDDLWRFDAEQRIEENRKSSVTVNVTDANGDPLHGAFVGLRQRKHHFLFGSAINAYGGKLDPAGNETALKYQSEIKRLFNAVVLENSLKWPGFENDRDRGLQGAAFATDNDLYLRGHNIIWPSRTFMPNSVWSEYDSRVGSAGSTAANEWLKSTIEARFDDVLATFDGVVPEWDVVNEPWSNHDVMDLLGDSVLVDWFQRVRDFDPSIQLALNDFGIFSRNGANTGHRDDFEYWLGLLNDAGLLDVIGEQSHYDEASLTDIEVLGQLVQAYSTQFDAPIAITEFDVNTRDEQLQADYLRDYMTMSFSQPAIEQFLHWGFWQDSHWLPDAALFRSDFSIKPNGQAYEDLVFGSWWTDVQGSTADGAFTASAFLGEYDVVVQYAGQTVVSEVSVDDSGNATLSLQVNADPVNYGPIVEVADAILNGSVAEPLMNLGRYRDPESESVSMSASVGDVTVNADGTWQWVWTPTETAAQVVTITATDASGQSTQATFDVNVSAVVRQREISYGGSSFGEDIPALDKVALLPGQLASVENYSNYALGLNRIRIEVAGLNSETLTAEDFRFRVGNTEDPSEWPLLSGDSEVPLPSIIVTPTATPGVDAVMLTWPDNAIENQWLGLTLLANSNTGLSGDDEFYFGNQIGDTNGDVDANNRVIVDELDARGIRAAASGFSSVSMNNPFDMDRDQVVNSFDHALAQTNFTSGDSLLMLDLRSNGSNNVGGDSKAGTDKSALGALDNHKEGASCFAEFEAAAGRPALAVWPPLGPRKPSGPDLPTDRSASFSNRSFASDGKLGTKSGTGSELEGGDFRRNNASFTFGVADRIVAAETSYFVGVTSVGSSADLNALTLAVGLNDGGVDHGGTESAVIRSIELDQTVWDTDAAVGSTTTPGIAEVTSTPGIDRAATVVDLFGAASNSQVAVEDGSEVASLELDLSAKQVGDTVQVFLDFEGRGEAVGPEAERIEFVQQVGTLTITVRGDANGDGRLTNTDIGPFLLALTNRIEYANQYPLVDVDSVLDFNSDQRLTNADIAGFLAALTG